MKTKDKKPYVSPAFNGVETVLSEDALLSESALVGRNILIIGQDIDQFYTTEDISEYWD